MNYLPPSAKKFPLSLLLHQYFILSINKHLCYFFCLFVVFKDYFYSFLQEVGYSGEIGYQTFLYSNENDIRKIFMFLIEKVPKESTETRDEPLSKSNIYICSKEKKKKWQAILFFRKK